MTRETYKEIILYYNIMNWKKKGTDAERELIHMFWNNAWACIRSAGSGSMSFPSPDILAGNAVRKIAVESKVSTKPNKYFLKEEIKQLKNFCEYFGAEPWIALKFRNKEWFFFNIEDLKETPKGFSVNEKMCDLKGIRFDQLIY